MQLFLEDFIQKLKSLIARLKLSKEYLSLFFRWILEQMQYNYKSKKFRNRRVIKKGEIYWCNFGLNIGSEYSSISENANMRPCLVLGNNMFINSNNTIVAPLTSFKNSKKIMSTDYLLKKSNNNQLDKDSIIKLSHLRDVSHIRLGKRIGKVSKETISEIEKNLLIIFDIKK